jgi:hypothetical protein
MRFVSLAFAFALASVLSFSACSSAPGGVTRSSADSFEKALFERLKTLGPAVEVANQKGGEGSAYSKDLSYSIPADKLIPGRLSEHVLAILPAWMEYQNASQKGTSGTGPKISLHCGNADSHLFVDVIARAVESVVYVDVLVRGVE